MLQWTLGYMWSNCVLCSIYVQYWDCWIILEIYPLFLKEFLHCSPQWLYLFTFTPTEQKGSFFSTSSPAFTVFRFFDDGHSDQSKVIAHCNFDLCFSNNEWCWAYFYVFISPSVCLFWLFFWYWAVCAACIVWRLITCHLFHLLLLSPILRVAFSPCV